MTLNQKITQLIAYAKKHLGLSARDELYARNRLLDALGLYSYTDEECSEEIPALPDGILQDIFAGLEEDGREFDRLTLGEKLMDAVMPRPSEFENTFYQKYESSPKAATE